jgi:hypothetical protein
MRPVFFASLFVLGVAIAACSATGNNQFTTGTGNSGNGGSGAGSGMGGDVNLGAGIGHGGSTTGGDCSDAAKLVYVLSTDNDIWSFEPANKQFTQVMSLNCPTPNDGNSWAPNSMAVDRNAVAWVNYVGSDTLLGTDSAGLIFRVDIQKKSCDPTPAVHLPNDQWFRLGMGFSTDSVGGTTETLYVTGTGQVGAASSPGLGSINMTSKTLVASPGQFSGDAQLAGQSAELTGTGDAKLFGFFTTTPVRVGQIDKGTAKILSDDAVNGVATPLAWAFSFWGGSFYLYTSDGTSQSTVTKFDPSTHAVDSSYQLTAPMIIVGAGVSTCAPLTPPK